MPQNKTEINRRLNVSVLHFWNWRAIVILTHSIFNLKFWLFNTILDYFRLLWVQDNLDRSWLMLIPCVKYFHFENGFSFGCNIFFDFWYVSVGKSVTPVTFKQVNAYHLLSMDLMHSWRKNWSYDYEFQCKSKSKKVNCPVYRKMYTM